MRDGERTTEFYDLLQREQDHEAAGAEVEHRPTSFAPAGSILDLAGR